MQLLSKMIAIFFLFPALTCRSQDNALDNYLSGVYKNNVIPGFAVVVIKKDKIVYSKGYGVESLDSKKPFTPHTVSAIGSLTKSMTALAMMQLIEQKKVELDKPVTKYLPWFRTANKERSDKITVRMLLNNTSGLYSNSSSQSDDTKENSLENLVRSLSSTYLIREPGISYQYSNVGFSVAGLIISKVSGMSYQQYVHDKIFQPLQMFHTSTEPKDFEKLGAINGHYYGINKAIAANQDKNKKLDGYIPAGSLMCSNAEDLGKYLLALMMAKNNLLSLQSRNEMWEQNISFPGITKEDGGDGKLFSYGLGWMISEIEGRQIIHHGGSTGKMSSFTVIDLKNEVAASILMNIDMTFIDKYSYSNEMNIINNIIRIETGLPTSKYGLPIVKDPTINNYSLNDTLTNHYAGTYQLKSENVVFLYQGAEMKIYKTANGLESSIYRDNQILNRCKIDFVNEAFAVSRNIASTVQMRFKLNPEGKVSGLFLNDMEFIKQDEIAAARNKIVSPAKTISFSLPKDWTIKWQKNDFIAQSKDGTVQLRGYIINASTTSSQDSKFNRFDMYAIKKSGLEHSENFGNYKWSEKAFFCKGSNGIKQIIRLRSTINGNKLSFILIAPEGELTANIQDVTNDLFVTAQIILPSTSGNSNFKYR